MVQIVRPGRKAVGCIVDIAVGGACAWRLPADARCASVGRSLLQAAMTTLGLSRDLVDTAVLAVSELVTNAFDHGVRAGPADPIAPPELWIWARAFPAPQLVVTVFDTCRTSWPDTASRGLLDEHGRGDRRCRRRCLGSSPVPVLAGGGEHAGEGGLERLRAAGALARPAPDLPALPGRPAPGRHAGRTGNRRRRPASHGGRLPGERSALRPRCRERVGEPGHPSFGDSGGGRVRCPLVNLHDVVEHLVCRFEERQGG
ncbi:ATP-binding protein [Actinomadura keratinilytica]|uniref:ATP-binding protein n=1 Tax=Actinomadura keratinilytica TaxID=547461 RepID=UPI00361A20F7